jgi:cytochrome c biogenesis protein ResB
VDERRYRSTDGRLVILMAETKSAMMFRSAMEVLNHEGKTLAGPDGKPFRRVVRVNHPLEWGGYAFYQNNFIPESANGPAASVFRVKYDRGIPTIYTGFVLLTLGVCTMLYVNPILRKRRRPAGSDGTAAKAPQEA